MAEPSKDLQVVQFGGMQLRQSEMDVITHTIAPGLDTVELELFFYECKRRGVHPMDRMIYPIKRNDKDSDTKKLTFQTSIDLFRASAEDTGKYVGQDPVVFGEMKKLSQVCPKTGVGQDEIMVPESATVTVLRKDAETGEVQKIPATAFMSEYYPGEKMGMMWRKMPRGQLSKCAEALALRKAFPRKLGGLYANEEVEKVDTDVPLAKVGTVKPAYKPAPGPAPETKTQAPQPDRQPGDDSEPPIEGEVIDKESWPIPGAFGDSKVKISLYNTMMKAANGDRDRAREILKEHSGFEGDNGTIFIDLYKLDKWKDAWCGRALNEWRKKHGGE